MLGGNSYDIMEGGVCKAGKVHAALHHVGSGGGKSRWICLSGQSTLLWENGKSGKPQIPILAHPRLTLTEFRRMEILSS